MKNRIQEKNGTVSLVLAIIAGLFGHSNAEWQATGGPWGGRIFSLAADEKYVIAGTGFGVFRSSDTGTNWEPAGHNMTNDYFGKYPPIRAVSVYDDFLFAGPEDGGIYRSSDYGETWIKSDSTVTRSNTVFSFFQHKGALFAGVDGYGLFRSTNKGTNWTNIYSDFGSLPGIFLRAFTVVDTILFAAEWHTGAIWRSIDNGIRWIKTKADQNKYCSLASLNGTLYAGTDNNRGVYCSSDSGKNWRQMNSGLPRSSAGEIYNIRTLHAHNDTLFAGTLWGGIFCKADKDTVWSAADSGIPGPPPPLHQDEVNAFTSVGNTLFAGTRSNGVFLSSDNGAYWDKSNNRLNSTSVFSMTVAGKILFAGTEGSGVFRSPDGGENWTQIDSSWSKLIGNDYLALYRSDEILFASCCGGPGVIVSDLQGTTWSMIDSSMCAYAFAGKGDTVYVGYQTGRVKLITNNGLNVEPAGEGLVPVRKVLFSIRTFALSGNYIFTGLDSGGVFRTQFGDKVWEPVNTGLPAMIAVYSLAAGENFIFAGTQGSVYRSDNAGATWIPAAEGLPNDKVNTLLFSEKGILFAGTERNGIFVSSNYGNRWSSFNTGFPSGKSVRALAIVEGELYAGIDRGGVWRRSTDEVPAAPRIEHSNRQATEKTYTVNHSGRRLTVTVSITRSEHIQITVFTFAGRKVSFFDAGEYPTGIHTVRFDLPANTHGGYIARLQVGSLTQVMRIISNN